MLIETAGLGETARLIETAMLIEAAGLGETARLIETARAQAQRVGAPVKSFARPAGWVPRIGGGGQA